ncbi:MULTISPECIES: tRNA 2-thiocytidine biosynthesis TtcA family protein [unclassified Pseudodesulfovibrio]|uniref:tRNA lysidine(34) synthetase n=1 Tax=unclassified Pseudodesulfovibrio TaxID=2661612 RepID=UPI000FEBA60D|nr:MULTISPECIES: tRNA 2-thiocytidine biosynthesis TtcA family protein [unclassified Pseudodesulfovibrio]MCJ2164024.1 tRNA 2-thiocytidine biosynthesis TtcA family protein [Pseudodesulfovibrio sp. S3-i]RWU05340.1 tRNA 2-thiocytidine biosynthesis protein TtcA [Pseudodesulfovibrio sp. S3]
MASWGKLTFAQKKCVSATGKLMQQTNMVSEGARIGLAVSGGVDSFLMLKVMTIRQAIMPFHIELMVLHVNPGFAPESHNPLSQWCAENGISAHMELTDFGPRAHTSENRKNSPCFFCAMQRRKRLFELCRDYNLSHLAFGHNADDNVVTFFMNILQNGRVAGLSINEPFFDGNLNVIRPTMFLDKKTVITASKQWELPIWENICPSNGSTKRDEINAWLQTMWRNDKRIKNNVFNAITRQQVDLTSKKV